MPNLNIPDDMKTAKEQLLLGDVVLVKRDCEGNELTVHGLMANDLEVKTLQGDVIPLTEFIQNYASANGSSVDNAVVTTPDGTTVTMKEVVEGLTDVQFTLSEIEQKYQNQQ